MRLIGLVVGWMGVGVCLRGEAAMTNIYDFTMRDIDGKEQSLSAYKGQVLLVVNVASKCGFTGQYEGLEKLYASYTNRGFVVLGFPANDFMRQEPGTEAEIKNFCTRTYGVTFPMFAKISVKGKGIHPLYAFLTSKETNPNFGGSISWNFNKFLIGRDGMIMGRFGSRTKPDDKELVEAVEKALNSSNGGM
jgi:glutathione peroxidase